MLAVNQLAGFGVGDSGPVSTGATGGTTAHSTAGVGFGPTRTWVDRTFTLTNNSYLFKVGFYCTTAGETVKAKLVKRTGAGTYDLIQEQSAVTTAAGDQDIVLSTPWLVPNDGGTYYIALYSVTNTPSFGFSSQSRAFLLSELTGTGNSLTEDTGNTINLRVTY
jgi:hypothetical protein